MILPAERAQACWQRLMSVLVFEQQVLQVC